MFLLFQQVLLILLIMLHVLSVLLHYCLWVVDDGAYQWCHGGGGTSKYILSLSFLMIDNWKLQSMWNNLMFILICFLSFTKYIFNTIFLYLCDEYWGCFFQFYFVIKHMCITDCHMYVGHGYSYKWFGPVLKRTMKSFRKFINQRFWLFRLHLMFSSLG